MKLVNLVNSYLAPNFYPEKANQLAIIQSRLILLPRVLYFGCLNQSGAKTFERKAEFGISSTSHWLLLTSLKQTDRSLYGCPKVLYGYCHLPTHRLFACTKLDVKKSMHGSLSIDSYVLFFINRMPKDDDDDDDDDKDDDDDEDDCDDYSLEDVGLKFQPGIQALRTISQPI